MSNYFWVTLGPIPDMPAWHQQSKPNSYPFPTMQAAERFAHNHPDRNATIKQGQP